MPQTPSDADGLEAAKRALRAAKEQHREVESRWRLVHFLSTRLRIEREENHFAPRIIAALEGDR